MEEKQKEKLEKNYKFCPNCGEELQEEAKFCQSCSQKLYENQKTEPIKGKLTKFKISKQTLIDLKEFIKNNFELMHTAYLIIFIIGLFSYKLGLITLAILFILSYYLSNQNKEQLVVNQEFKKIIYQVPSKNKELMNVTKDKTQTMFNKATSTVEKSSNDINQFESKIETIPLKKIKEGIKEQPVVTTSGLGMSGLLLIVSAIANLYGVLGSSFVKYPETSLFETIQNGSQLMSHYETAETFLSGSSSNTSQVISFVGYGLIALPILIMILGIMQSKGSRTLSFLLSLVELGVFLYVINYISEEMSSIFGNYGSDFFSTLFSYSGDIFGLPAYGLVFGVIGMVLFSFGRLIKR